MTNPFEISHMGRNTQLNTLVQSIATNITEIEDYNSAILNFRLNDDLLRYCKKPNWALKLTKIKNNIVTELIKLNTQYKSNSNDRNLTSYLTTLINKESEVSMLKETISKNYPFCITFKDVFDKTKK